MDNIKAVFFDFDDTLGNRQQAAYDTYGGFFADFLPDMKDERLIEAIKQDMCTAHQFGNIDFDYVVQTVNRNYKLNLPENNYSDWWTLNLNKYTVLFPDTIPTLETLKEKYRLGIITNGFAYSQWNKIRNAGIEKYFETIVVSEDIGIKKPAPGIFEHACRQMGLKPEECLHIGDTFANDVYGALNAGMQAVWIWHDTYRACDLPVTRITRIGELVDLLK